MTLRFRLGHAAVAALVALAILSPLAAAAGQGRAICQGHAATIVGTPGADRIVGTDRVDVIAAGRGDDFVRGMKGGDLLCGDGGDDLLRGGRGDDGMAGGRGDDRLLGGRGFDLVTYEDARRGVAVDLRRGTASGEGRDRVASVWWVVGSRGGDVVRGAGVMEIFVLLDGADRVHGGGGRDLVVAGGGRDVVSGGRGADRLSGQEGPDELSGGRGEDTVVFAGATAPVTVDLAAGTAEGEGSDSLKGFENVEGSPRADTIRGDGGENLLVGVEGSDTIRGRGGDDRVLGLQGDDDLGLGAGDDVGRGGRHDDFIDGGWGIDRVYGGAGHDVCRNGEILGCDEYELPLPP